MTAPKLLRQMTKFAQQLPRRLTLDHLHELAHAQVRRQRDKQVYVIAPHVARENVNLVGLANLSDQSAAALGDFTDQDGFAVFGTPYHMYLQVVDRVRGLSIVLHASKIALARLKLKSSPKGEGFSPIPRLGH